MPKKSRKRLTQPKGTSLTGRSTRSSVGSSAASDDGVPPVKIIREASETSAGAVHVSQPASLDVEEFPVLRPSSVPKIRILQNILLAPALPSDNASPILEKAKTRIRYYSLPVADIEPEPAPEPYMPLKCKSFIQDIVRLLACNRIAPAAVFEEMSLDDERDKSLILRMMEMFPSKEVDLLQAGPSFIGMYCFKSLPVLFFHVSIHTHKTHRHSCAKDNLILPNRNSGGLSKTTPVQHIGDSTSTRCFCIN